MELIRQGRVYRWVSVSYRRAMCHEQNQSCIVPARAASQASMAFFRAAPQW